MKYVLNFYTIHVSKNNECKNEKGGINLIGSTYHIYVRMSNSRCLKLKKNKYRYLNALFVSDLHKYKHKIQILIELYCEHFSTTFSSISWYSAPSSSSPSRFRVGSLNDVFNMWENAFQ